MRSILSVTERIIIPTMCGDEMIHPIGDYIDCVIATNGFISNDLETDTQFYKGYRVFVRYTLDKYESVEDWKEDQGGFQDRSRYEGYGDVTEYVFQEFSRGASVIIDAGLRSWDMGMLVKGSLESSVS